MSLINENYLKLKAGYLFPEIGRRVKKYSEEHPDKKVLRLGIGDVTLPLTPSIIAAFHKGVDEMADVKTFKGYGPEQGYVELRTAIAKVDYNTRGIKIDADEIFISDGSKCDTGNIQEIFSTQARIAVSDPVYPVYVDTNVMAGRTGECDEKGYFQNIIYMPTNEENNFSPALPSANAELIYLCSPNNPTGAVLSKKDLEKWVAYAKKNKSIILFDAAYEAFIRDTSLPRSIYEIPGAEEVAIEFRSLSKTAGFTGTRVAFTVVPKALKGFDRSGASHSIHALWNRRQSTKFNGVSYPVQKAAEAVYSAEGQKEVQGLVSYYMENAALIKKHLAKLGFKVFGGENAPYVWVKTKGQTSWDFFDHLLTEAQVVGTPGSGFGPNGEGYFRFSAFAARETVLDAMNRIEKLEK
jgi:LL-diaminopimelate aminotransferase